MTAESRDDQSQLERRITATLERSTHALDAETQQQLQQLRRAALQQTPASTDKLRPALMIAASVIALVLVTLATQPWRSALSPQDGPGQIAVQDAAAPATRHSSAADSSDSYLDEEPDLLADWDMLDAIGEAPDA